MQPLLFISAIAAQLVVYPAAVVALGAPNDLPQGPPPSLSPPTGNGTAPDLPPLPSPFMEPIPFKEPQSVPEGSMPTPEANHHHNHPDDGPKTHYPKPKVPVPKIPIPLFPGPTPEPFPTPFRYNACRFERGRFHTEWSLRLADDARYDKICGRAVLDAARHACGPVRRWRCHCIDTTCEPVVISFKTRKSCRAADMEDIIRKATNGEVWVRCA